MSFARFSVCLLLGACATPQAEVSKQDAVAVEPPPRTEIGSILDDATLERQERAVMFERRFAQAKALWRAQRPEEALEATEHALLLQPGKREATELRDSLRLDLGYRAGGVAVLATEEIARYAASLEEERLSVERLIARAERSRQGDNWDEARRSYEAALFVLRTSRFSSDVVHVRLARDATQRAHGLANEQRAREKARREREAAAALREIARHEENSR